MLTPNKLGPSTHTVHSYRSRERPKKLSIDCVKDDVSRKEVTADMMTDREIWKRKICYVNSK